MAQTGIGNVAPNSQLLEMAMSCSRSRMVCAAARLGRLMSDLNMMAVTGGKERSAREWRELLAAGGFEMKRIVPVVDAKGDRQDVSIVEAAPASAA